MGPPKVVEKQCMERDTRRDKVSVNRPTILVNATMGGPIQLTLPYPVQEGSKAMSIKL